jgi:3-carboxy-cis,cis-muconate cycloisomerase
VTTFAAIFVPGRFRDATSDAAWLQAMLDVERALAVAEARVGVISAETAARIGESCKAELFDADQLAEEGRSPGNPVEPLVGGRRARVGGEAADFVHWGATSQDILDTAAMLVARRTLALILDELDEAAQEAAGFAEAHAATPMVARTLLQQASPTTFGLKAAGWLSGLLEARAALARVREERLAVQLGGAVGTLAALGDRGPEIVTELADELGLGRPIATWHTDRARVSELAGALELAAAASSKIGLDVALLAQTEVAEVSVRGGGVSSTLPHKQNPVAAALALACSRRVTAAAASLRSGEHEHERAVRAWHAEWSSLSDALALAGGAVAATRELLAGLEVDADRMRRNLEAGGGLAMAERLSFLLAGSLGLVEARACVSDAAARARANGTSLREELSADERVTLAPADLDAAFDPAGYLGSARVLVDSVLDLHRSTIPEQARA